MSQFCKSFLIFWLRETECNLSLPPGLTPRSPPVWDPAGCTDRVAATGSHSRPTDWSRSPSLSLPTVISPGSAPPPPSSHPQTPPSPPSSPSPPTPATGNTAHQSQAPPWIYYEECVAGSGKNKGFGLNFLSLWVFLFFFNHPRFSEWISFQLFGLGKLENYLFLWRIKTW